MEPWIILAALGGIASNINNFLNRYILIDDQDPSAYSWFHESFRVLFSIPLIFLFPLPIISPSLIMSLIVVGVLEFVSVILWMRMFAFTHLSISALISRTRLIWVPVLALLILGERLSANDYIGIGILFLGVSVAVAPRKIMIDRGVKYSYAAALMISFLTIGQKYISSIASVPFLTAAISLPSVLLLPLFMKSPKERIIKTFKKKLLLKSCASLLNILSLYLLFLALRAGPVGTVNGIYQAMIVVSIFLGVTVLSEREDIWKKIIGTLVVVVGIILVSAV